MREIFRNFSEKLRLHRVSKQVKQRKTAIHESIHHLFIIHPGRVQTTGLSTIMIFSLLSCSLILCSLLGDIVDISCYVSWHFYITNCRKISTEFFRKSTVIFPEISGKIPQEISQLTTLLLSLNPVTFSALNMLPPQYECHPVCKMSCSCNT